MTKYIVSMLLVLVAAHASAQSDVVKNPGEITPLTLDGVRLLELGLRTRGFVEAEIKAVTAFVKQGGSLLVIIDEERRSKLLPNGINMILSEFGMEFTPDVEYLHNCGALAKAGAVNAADREIAYSGGRAVKGGTPFAWRLDATGERAETYAAYAEFGDGGRVIALAEGMANLGVGTAKGERLSGVPRNPRKTTYWGKDSKVFMREVRDWLLKRQNKSDADDGATQNYSVLRKDQWTMTNTKWATTVFKGKRAMRLEGWRAMATLKDMAFEDGTIEMDIAAGGKGQFYIGVAFRVQDKIDRNLSDRDNYNQLFENVIFRPFRSGTPIAVQYAAAGTKYSWKYLRNNHPGKYEGNADLSETGWFHVRIEVAGQQAQVFVNNAKTPAFVVNDLKHGRSKGSVGITSVWKTAYFANVTVTKRKRVIIAVNPRRITAEDLEGVQLLELGLRTRTFNEAEIKAVTNFVQGGGALLVIIDEESRSKLLPNGINKILAHFGLKFTPDLTHLHNCGALAKAGVINKADREVAYSGGRAVEGGTPFAWRLDEKGKPAEVYGTYVELENGGRIVAIAEAMANLNVWRDKGKWSGKGKRLSGVPYNPAKTTYWGKDSRLFMREVRDWLLKKQNKPDARDGK